MAHNIQELLDSIRTFGQEKSASSIENVEDPDKKGTAKAPEGTTLGAPSNPTNTDSEDEVLPGGQKTNHAGDGKAPPHDKKPDEVDNIPASNKSASETFQARIAGLQSKLASLFEDEPAKEAGAAPAAPAKEAGAVQPEGEEAAKPGFLHLKIAEHLLSTEAGRELVTSAVQEINGYEYASQLVKQAYEQQTAIEKATIEAHLAAMERAELAKAAAEQEAERQEYVSNLVKQASAEEIEDVNNAMVLLSEGAKKLDQPVLKAAYAGGVDDAMAYAGAADQAAEGGGAPPAPEEMMGGDGEPSIEEIAQILAELVESGEIPPDQAEQFMQELSAAMQAGGGEALPKEAAEAVEFVLHKSAAAAGIVNE